jgi:hypothetical protein
MGVNSPDLVENDRAVRHVVIVEVERPAGRSQRRLPPMLRAAI